MRNEQHDNMAGVENDDVRVRAINIERRADKVRSALSAVMDSEMADNEDRSIASKWILWMDNVVYPLTESLSLYDTAPPEIRDSMNGLLSAVNDKLEELESGMRADGVM